MNNYRVQNYGADFLCPQLSTVQQSLALLRQDKEYLGRQVSELGRRASLAEERGDALVQQLGETKQAKEKLYEHFLKTR